MTKEQIALARRAVACKGWRWMPGMLTSFNARHLGRHLWVDQGSSVVVYADQNDGEVPDLTDPATLGCLLALVREAWKGYRLWLEWNDEGQNYQLAWWREFDKGSHQHVWVVTEAEALVAALEAAP
jgi:hypothetical protein